MNSSLSQAYPKVVLSAEQIRKRVQEMAHQISRDYQGKTVFVVGVRENSFIFVADLVRELDLPVVCNFVKPEFKDAGAGTTEIFFAPVVDVRDQEVLLVETVIQSGVTSEFLVRHFQAQGARGVKVAVLLDKQASRRVSMQPDYFGFLLNNTFVVGYGLGAPDVGRNLPYIAAGTVNSPSRLGG